MLTRRNGSSGETLTEFFRLTYPNEDSTVADQTTCMVRLAEFSKAKSAARRFAATSSTQRLALTSACNGAQCLFCSCNVCRAGGVRDQDLPKLQVKVAMAGVGAARGAPRAGTIPACLSAAARAADVFRK